MNDTTAGGGRAWWKGRAQCARHCVLVLHGQIDGFMHAALCELLREAYFKIRKCDIVEDVQRHARSRALNFFEALGTLALQIPIAQSYNLAGSFTAHSCVSCVQKGIEANKHGFNTS